MNTRYGGKTDGIKQEITAVTAENTLRRSPRLLPLASKKNKKQKTVEKREPDTLSLPVIVFKGKINYADDFNDCAMICDNIIQEVENHKNDIVPIGFDIEWPFSFLKGSRRTALAQICPNKSSCYLLHLYYLYKLPAAFVVLLSHPKVKLVGVNIKNDIWKLGRDFQDFPAAKIVENNCIDCGTFANKVLNRSERWSLERLTAYLLQKQIDKNSEIRNSKWDIQPLSKEQKVYAATDAYVSLLLYLVIQEKSAELEIESNETMLSDKGI